jgi:hypothetical protein
MLLEENLETYEQEKKIFRSARVDFESENEKEQNHLEGAMEIRNAIHWNIIVLLLTAVSPEMLPFS